MERCPSWLKEHAWKACVGQKLTAGSNPALSAIFFGRDAGAVDRGGLENRCPLFGGPWVRIPLSPPFIYLKLKNFFYYST